MKAMSRLQENLKFQHSPSKLPIQMVRIPYSSVAIMVTKPSLQSPYT